MIRENIDKILYGEKVVLRPITMEDTDYIVKWRNNPSVQKNFIFREKFTIHYFIC